MVLNKQVWGKNKVILKQEVDDVYIIKKKKNDAQLEGNL